jgi:hypothetical protein
MPSDNSASLADCGVRRFAAAFTSGSLLRRSQNGVSISAQASPQILDALARIQEAARKRIFIRELSSSETKNQQLETRNFPSIVSPKIPRTVPQQSAGKKEGA